ncbi:nitrite reductase small subunit NirD [Tamlana sp. 2_MG-2023]|uniref:nitrite reductase small subunit NirD n=1 Tax=unclassified Tamlana TaxID=2614803 RepID=UPI0026E36C2F|nr:MULTISPECIES: nitrite reductase small subunit NirD [unclassified Tamlana]MDO6758976.1 nitrite reductase small subunit NirD [Tamlana sp. 2_MG-2023]MDO6789675.1 nitrite reductase small subunit NirD [Tamlana sp. 1_MG-2023]
MQEQDILDQYQSVSEEQVKDWFKVGVVEDFPENSGACIKYKTKQIAVYNFTRTGKWYASQNLCPHKMEMVLSLGMIGDKDGIPKVACPMHKKNFSLEDGSNMAGEDLKIATYPVKIEKGNVYIGFSD